MMIGDFHWYHCLTGRCTFSTGLSGVDSTEEPGVAVRGVIRKQLRPITPTFNKRPLASARATVQYTPYGKNEQARRYSSPSETTPGARHKRSSLLIQTPIPAGVLATTLFTGHGTSSTIATLPTRFGNIPVSLEHGAAGPFSTRLLDPLQACISAASTRVAK